MKAVERSAPEPDAIRELLVRGPNWLGDLVMTTPALFRTYTFGEQILLGTILPFPTVQRRSTMSSALKYIVVGAPPDVFSF